MDGLELSLDPFVVPKVEQSHEPVFDFKKVLKTNSINMLITNENCAKCV